MRNIGGGIAVAGIWIGIAIMITFGHNISPETIGSVIGGGVIATIAVAIFL